MMDDRIQQIVERLRHNEQIARKFYDVELKILSILDFRGLFEVLLTEIRSKFNIPFVWISFIENSEVSQLIHELPASGRLREQINIIDRKSIEELLGENPKPVLANHHLKHYYKLFPKRKKFAIKSIAIIPIFMDGNLIGILNQADTDKDRFHPDYDTAYLEQLGVKVSLCLSNVTAHEKLKKMAYRDPLTGLLNRRILESVLAREWIRFKRYQTPFCVAFCDLDHFKSINDRYGHEIGDALLKLVAEAMTAESRKADVVARYGGDEFVLVFPHTDKSRAEAFVKRLCSRLESSPLTADGKSVTACLTYGIAHSEEKEISSPEALLTLADSRLLSNKKKHLKPTKGAKIIPLQKPK